MLERLRRDLPEFGVLAWLVALGNGLWIDLSARASLCTPCFGLDLVLAH
ncbi:hypothetical protein [Chromobacterium violaceum]|nr:hypothetical protein [Chromobacterium violaceum]